MLDTARSKISKPRTAKSKPQKSSSKSKINAAKAISAVSSQPSNLPPQPDQPTLRSSKKPAHSPPPPQTENRPKTMPQAPPTTTTTTTTATTLPSIPTTTTPTPLPPLRDLASSTPSLRRAALTALTDHLAALPPRAHLPPQQAQQLWRALYVALYLHDSKNAVSVQNLVRTMAGLGRGMWVKDCALLGEDGGTADTRWTWSSVWMEAFWGEMAREWIGVDQWRMNKVLMLVRMVVAEGFALVRETASEGKGAGGDGPDDGWKDYVAEVVALPLEVQRELPDGLRIHVLDVWGDELEKLVGEEGDQGEKDREVTDMLAQAAKELSVFRQGEANVPKNVRNRAKEVVQQYGA